MIVARPENGRFERSGPMRSAVLGVGGFGREVLPALVANGIEIATVVDHDAAALAEAVRTYDLASSAVYDSDEGGWWDTNVQMVVDCTPPGGHLRHAEAAFQAGLDVLVAKPMALSLADASRMVELAGLAGRRLATIQQMRYLPAFLRVRDIIAQGTLGRLGVVTITFNVDGTFWQPGLAWRLAMDQPLLWEGSVHVLDLVRWVTEDEPAAVVAHAFQPPWSEFRGPAGLVMCAELRGGTTVRYLANWAPRGSTVVPLNSGWELEFDHGIVTVTEESVMVNGETLLAPPARLASLADLNTRLVRWYVDWVAGQDAAGPTGADNLRTVAFADAVQRASTSGSRVIL
ncbi:Gfo/Idh/MocA family protein [Nonomuraea sp. NPDC051941]|uniref:Gfo/Idh/MocA family protein n=1 Tax=Nonomuraea sp. NPDC051941 TaxID=3364373 RepID=UPI0037C62491